MWTLVSRYQNVSILDFVGAMCLKDAKQLWNMLTKPISKFCSTDIYQWCRRWKKNFLARCLLLIGSISASVHGCEIHNASAWTRLLCTRMWPRSIPARKPTGGCTFIITHTHTHHSSEHFQAPAYVKFFFIQTEYCSSLLRRRLHDQPGLLHSKPGFESRCHP